MLKIGDKAPDFSLLDQDGKTCTLNEFRGKKVLVWFYPKASTPGCTAEGCSLRDHTEKLKEKDVVILGISMDSVKRQQNFAKKQNFPYQLLSDPDKIAIQGFGAWGTKKFMGKVYDGILRSSFLIDEEGKIAHVFSKVKTKTHGEDVLSLLSSLEE